MNIAVMLHAKNKSDEDEDSDNSHAQPPVKKHKVGGSCDDDEDDDNDDAASEDDSRVVSDDDGEDDDGDAVAASVKEHTVKVCITSSALRFALNILHAAAAVMAYTVGPLMLKDVIELQQARMRSDFFSGGERSSLNHGLFVFRDVKREGQSKSKWEPSDAQRDAIDAWCAAAHNGPPITDGKKSKKQTASVGASVKKTALNQFDFKAGAAELKFAEPELFSELSQWKLREFCIHYEPYMDKYTIGARKDRILGGAYAYVRARLPACLPAFFVAMPPAYCVENTSHVL